MTWVIYFDNEWKIIGLISEFLMCGYILTGKLPPLWAVCGEHPSLHSASSSWEPVPSHFGCSHWLLNRSLQPRWTLWGRWCLHTLVNSRSCLLSPPENWGVSSPSVFAATCLCFPGCWCCWRERWDIPAAQEGWSQWEQVSWGKGLWQVWTQGAETGRRGCSHPWVVTEDLQMRKRGVIRPKWIWDTMLNSN